MLAPDHRLKALRVKTLYTERKKRLGCADMYNETSTKRRQWQDEMVKNLQEHAADLKEETGGLLEDLKNESKELDFINSNYTRSRKSRFRFRSKSRSKSRLVAQSAGKSRLTISVGMTQAEYNAAFDRMFRKKAKRENVSACDGVGG